MSAGRRTQLFRAGETQESSRAGAELDRGSIRSRAKSEKRTVSDARRMGSLADRPRRLRTGPPMGKADVGTAMSQETLARRAGHHLRWPKGVGALS